VFDFTLNNITMPRLSLYHPQKTQDYSFFDKRISEMLTAGGTDLYIHKYLGPTNQGPSSDYTQPQYDTLNPNNIQDLLFLENRDRSYDPNIYRLRGHYNVQNLDFDLSQFGLFLNNNIIFITVHYNDMIEIIGRKLMVGDVLELPHLLDYNPLPETLPTALKRFMQITDANYASEGFSPTWYPHLWRIKCEPLVNSEEFQQILSAPTNTDNYLGIYDNTKGYPAGYVITFGNKNYISTQPVPAGISPPNADYWSLDTASNLSDILSTYNTNIAINDANLQEAERIVPKSGYDNSNLYIVPTYGEYESNGVLSGKIDQPAPPVNVLAPNTNVPTPLVGTLMTFKNSNYKNASTGIVIPKAAINRIQNIMSSNSVTDLFDKFVQASLQIATIAPEKFGSGSGQVSGTNILVAASMGIITGPYGTADNTYATADQDPTAPGFTGTEPYGPNTMDYRADCDPRFQFIARSTPRSFGYASGYLTGSTNTPNGFTSGAGISFPQNPQVGDYFLRIDYFPNVLFRWDGTTWVRISENVRTGTGMTGNDLSQKSSFINNSNVTVLTNGTTVTQAQPLSSILTQGYPPLPPVVD